MCLCFFSPEVQSILNLSPPQDAELMNANPSPPVSIFELNSELCASSFVYTRHMQGMCILPLSTCFPYIEQLCYSTNSLHPSSLLQPSPSQQINLGPSSNPSAKPSDFHFLKVIGKGSFGKVLLARHRTDDQFYAVKVLQKKAILKKKEVNAHTHRGTPLEAHTHNTERSVLGNMSNPSSLCNSGETHHVREECAAKECQAPVLSGPALFFPNGRQTLFHPGLHQWRRGESLTELLP